jgi:hypothetical protein
VILTAITKKWRGFWFEPIGTETIAIYRILFGFLAVVDLVDISASFSVWYGRSGIMPVDILQKVFWQGQARFDLFLLSPDDWTSQAYLYSLIVAAVCLMLGLGTRFSAGYLAMGFVSLYHHNPYIFNAGEALFRLNSIFLTFTPSNEHYSLDSWLRSKRGLPAYPPLRCPWAQRMIQLQLTIAYFSAFWAKTLGLQWRDGSAVYYASRLTELINFPMPLLDQIWFCRLSSWAVLLIEFTGFTLIWFKPVRPYVLIAMLLLHLGIAYLFILPFFQFLFMVTLVTFMEPELVKDMMAVGADVFQYARAMVKSGKQAKSDSPV